MNYYKITPEQAKQIGAFEYAPNKRINPFVGEQEDGCFLIAESLYKEIQDNENLKGIDFAKLELLPQEKLIPKKVALPWEK